MILFRDKKEIMIPKAISISVAYLYAVMLLFT